VRTIALANSKGGAGKTTLSVHLASGFAKRKLRTLLVDMDVNGSSTVWLMGAPPPGVMGAYDALMGAELTPRDATPVPGREGLWLLPSTPKIARVAVELANEIGGALLLRDALQCLREDFDICVLDCPGDLNVVVLAALCAADGVVAPVVSNFLGVMGLAKLDETLMRARKRLSAHASLLGYVHFDVDARKAIGEEVREALAKTGMLLETEVRTSARAEDMPRHHSTAWDRGVDRRGAEDYEALLDAVLEKMDALKKRVG
jgi:chromosome partitioning protein